jgi:hypothetical protein
VGRPFDLPGRQLAFDTAYETMLLTVQRRDRLDTAITAMAAKPCDRACYRRQAAVI